MVTNIWSLLDCNSAYLHVAISHVWSALNRTLLQLLNQSYFSLLLSSFLVSSPLHASKRLLRSVGLIFSSFLLRFPYFIFLVLFPLQFLLLICCRGFLAPTNFFSFSSLSFSLYYLFHFFSPLGIGCVSAAFCRADGGTFFYEKSVPTSQTTRPYFTIWTPEIFSVCHPTFSFLWLGSASGPWSPHLWAFEITLRHSAFGRNSLDKPFAETSVWQHTAITASGGFKPANLASEQQQIHRLDHTANGIVWSSSQLPYFAFLASGTIYKIVHFNLEEWHHLEATNQSVKHLAALRVLEFANYL